MARAAHHLGLSQPAISKVIADLEKDLGVELFERGPHGTHLTACGRVLLQRGKNMLDELKQGLDEIHNLSDPTSGEARIGVVEAWTPFVASAVNRTSRRFARIKFTVTVGDVDTLIRSLRDRALDLVVSREELAVHNDDLVAQHLFHDRLVVVCSPKHPLAARRKITVSELVDEKWALGPSTTFLGRLLTTLFRRHGVGPPRTVVVTPSVQMRLDLLADGQFITVYSQLMLRYLGDRHRLKEISVDLGDVSAPMAALTLKSRPPSGAVRLVMGELRSAAMGR
jgi:DNA-binding transcriptional LysR family regulator